MSRLCGTTRGRGSGRCRRDAGRQSFANTCMLAALRQPSVCPDKSAAFSVAGQRGNSMQLPNEACIREGRLPPGMTAHVRTCGATSRCRRAVRAALTLEEGDCKEDGGKSFIESPMCIPKAEEQQGLAVSTSQLLTAFTSEPSSSLHWPKSPRPGDRQLRSIGTVATASLSTKAPAG